MIAAIALAAAVARAAPDMVIANCDFSSDAHAIRDVPGRRCLIRFGDVLITVDGMEALPGVHGVSANISRNIFERGRLPRATQKALEADPSTRMCDLGVPASGCLPEHEKGQ